MGKIAKIQYEDYSWSSAHQPHSQHSVEASTNRPFGLHWGPRSCQQLDMEVFASMGSPALLTVAHGSVCFSGLKTPLNTLQQGIHTAWIDSAHALTYNMQNGSILAVDPKHVREETVAVQLFCKMTHRNFKTLFYMCLTWHIIFAVVFNTL